MSQIQDAIKQGLAALASPSLGIQKLMTYTAVKLPKYDPTTGAVTATSTDFKNVPVVFTRYRRSEIDGSAIRAEDQKAIIATLDLSVAPTVNDIITMANSSVWAVIDIKTDPASAAWVLQVRRP